MELCAQHIQYSASSVLYINTLRLCVVCLKVPSNMSSCVLTPIQMHTLAYPNRHTCMYTHPHTHTDICTHIHTHTQTYAHTSTHTHRHMYTHPHTHTDICTHIHTHTDICTHMNTHVRYMPTFCPRQFNVSSLVHAPIRIHTHTHITHTHIHTYITIHISTHMHTPYTLTPRMPHVGTANLLPSFCPTVP